MNKKVGIPRSLFYYQFYPLWKSFFEELGAEVIVSDNTSRKILDDGVKKCVDEACLPVKIFYGHIENLKDKVDYLFVPRYTSVSKKEYVCPKFGGIPDMIRNTIGELPEIIDTEINLRNSKRNALKAAIEIGKYFTGNNRVIRKAYKTALANYKAFRKQVKSGILPSELLGNRKYNKDDTEHGKRLNIAVLGHGYNLYDHYSNMNVLHKLDHLGANVITVDMIDGKIINEKSRLLNKKAFWYFGTKIMGSAYHLLERNDIDGIIYIMSFGCGIDSFICDLVERKIRRTKNVPFIILTIDEHSGEAGMNTRIEAFIDMIRWRSNHEDNISSHGEHIYMRQSTIG